MVDTNNISKLYYIVEKIGLPQGRHVLKDWNDITFSQVKICMNCNECKHENYAKCENLTRTNIEYTIAEKCTGCNNKYCYKNSTTLFRCNDVKKTITCIPKEIELTPLEKLFFCDLKLRNTLPHNGTAFFWYAEDDEFFDDEIILMTGGYN